MKKKIITFLCSLIMITAQAQDSTARVKNNWDKTFPKSDKVSHEKVTFRNRFGITLAADLYIPKAYADDKANSNNKTKLPCKQ